MNVKDITSSKMKSHHKRNDGIPFDTNLFKDININRSAVERRAATLSADMPAQTLQRDIPIAVLESVASENLFCQGTKAVKQFHELAQKKKYTQGALFAFCRLISDRFYTSLSTITGATPPCSKAHRVPGDNFERKYQPILAEPIKEK